MLHNVLQQLHIFFSMKKKYLKCMQHIHFKLYYLQIRTFLLKVYLFLGVNYFHNKHYYFTSSKNFYFRWKLNYQCLGQILLHATYKKNVTCRTK